MDYTTLTFRPPLHVDAGETVQIQQLSGKTFVAMTTGVVQVYHADSSGDLILRGTVDVRD